MGRELLEREAAVRDEVAACDAVVRDIAGWSVAEQLAASDGESRLHETEVAQVAIGTLQLGLAALWRARGVEPEAVACHSPLLDGCDRELAARLTALRPRAGDPTLYSTVTGGRLHPQRLDAAHWGRNLREAVLLRPAIDAMAADGISVFIELGPHPVLL